MQTNFLVIGSGIAGLNFALQAAKKGKVTIVTKKKLIDSNTNFAQGGIAAVLDQTDNFEKHVEDTLKAGSYHNNKKAVEFMVKNSADAIYRLIDLGVEFQKENGKLSLTKEGGHSERRIAFVGDYTGKEIERILVKRVKEHPNITILEDAFALRLLTQKSFFGERTARARSKANNLALPVVSRSELYNDTCIGAQIIRGNKIENILADQTILSTGGVGQLFLQTTNPQIATADGTAMASQIGCKMKDIEFIQFHPTALNKNTFPKFLISETVRGEGAKLVNKKGENFMKNAHPLKDLAPRDIVAREIYQQQKTGQVFLDIRHKSREYLKKRFPQIYEKLKKLKIDMAKDLIPVTPAAHYECGGIEVDLNGQTSVKNLFAFGEVSYTGVHGANRLASNSLLEALVFSNQVAKNLTPNQKIKQTKFDAPKILRKNTNETILAEKLKKEIKNIMWEYAGIVRNLKRIKKEAIPKIEHITKELKKMNGTNQEIAETLNMATTSLLILKAAYKRKKSLGCHFVA
ncbi:MAG: L-aspartate oxidase [Candidatus Peregrinibacteria bacterium]|nr:L-aspartate oxidase [Candidatus Peregrinibacteria bacterium]